MGIRHSIILLLLLGRLFLVAACSHESGHSDSGDHSNHATPVSSSTARSNPNHDSRAHQHDGRSALPVAVDGAKTPERIPDGLAYAHFLSAIAEHEQASPGRLQRRSSMIARVGLSTTDATALVAALTGVRAQLDMIQAGRSSSARPTSTAQASLQAHEEVVLAHARERAYRALSPAGVVRLDRFVREHVKIRIVIYGAVPGEDD